jgi:D-citramalate synthase
MKIEIMDTTLRDGEQTSGVAFTDTEKLTISKMLLEELKVDRIEVASAMVSQGEFEAVKKITAWAKEKGFLEKIAQFRCQTKVGNQDEFDRKKGVRQIT